jgi:hypothetical protein
MSTFRSRSHITAKFFKEKDVAIDYSSKHGDVSVWGYEFPPFISKKTGKKADGARCYYVLDPAAAFKMMFHEEKDTLYRNYYEVIFGKCRLFADYDLAIPSIQKATGDIVMGVHTVVDRVVREKLAEFYPTLVISKIDYCILTAHIDGVKESMHVVWRLFGEEEKEIIFGSIEEVRRFMAMCINVACDSLGPAHNESMLPEDPRNPLFDHSKDLHPCILDIGVYNEYRNFRLIHNVKADVVDGRKRAWLSDPSCNYLAAEQRGKPTVRISFPEFLRHLIRVWDYAAEKHTIAPMGVIKAEIKFPKYKASGHTTKKKGPAAQYKASRRAGGTCKNGGLFEVLDSTLSRMSLTDADDTLLKIKKLVLGWVNSMFPSHAHDIVHPTDSGFTISSDAIYCPYKGADHRSSPGVSYAVFIEYPLPVIKRKCFKGPCVTRIDTEGAMLLPLDAVSQEDKNTYALLVWEYLNHARAPAVQAQE